MDLGKKGVGPGEQDWGYIKVRPGANMFWWLYYTTANVTHYRERPLIIWLQGKNFNFKQVLYENALYILL